MDAMGKGVQYFALTTDGWTSKQITAMSPTQCTTLMSPGTLRSHLLDTTELSVEHTGVNLATELEKNTSKVESFSQQSCSCNQRQRSEYCVSH